MDCRQVGRRSPTHPKGEAGWAESVEMVPAGGTRTGGCDARKLAGAKRPQCQSRMRFVPATLQLVKFTETPWRWHSRSMARRIESAALSPCSSAWR